MTSKPKKTKLENDEEEDTGLGLPEPWELLVRPAGSEEAKDSSFCLEDEALQDQVEQATKCVVVVDCSQPQHPIVCVTKGAEAMTGFSAQELCGERLDILNGEKTEPAALEEIARAFEDGQPTVLDLTHYKRNKQMFRNMLALVPMVDTSGQLVRMVCLMQDISDRRRGDAPTAMLRELVERQMRCFMLVDAAAPDCPIQSITDGFQEMSGFSSSAVTGLSCLCLCGPDTDKVNMSKLVLGMRDLACVGVRLLAYRQSGDPFWAQMVAFPHIQGGGKQKSGVVTLSSHQKQVVVMVSDVTQQRPKKVGKYQLGKVIGAGASGVVRKGRDMQTNEMVAIKMVNGSNFRNIQEIEHVQDEMRVLSSLKHENIIRLMDVQYIGNCIYFVMEFAGGGELHKYMWEKEDHRLSEEEARVMFRQVVSALDYCHRRRIVHRDLKPENLLMDEMNNIKVADFGLAGITSPFNKNLNQSVGTPEFAAPEIVNGQPYEGTAVDIWSLGVILYEMTCGHLPFKGNTMRDLFKKISKGEMAPMLPHLSADLKDLVKKMLHIEPSKRLTLQQIKKHRWVYMPGDEDEGMEAVTKRTTSLRSMSTRTPQATQGGDDRIFSDHTHASLNLVIPMSSLAVEGGLGGGGRKREDSAVSLGGPDGHDSLAPSSSMAFSASGAGAKKGGLVAGRGAAAGAATAAKDGKSDPKKTAKPGLLAKYGSSAESVSGSASPSKAGARAAGTGVAGAAAATAKKKPAEPSRIAKDAASGNLPPISKGSSTPRSPGAAAGTSMKQRLAAGAGTTKGAKLPPLS